MAQTNLLNSGAGRLENHLATVHPYWTGIWDTHNLASGPVWLVSGEAPDPGTAVWADLEIELLGRGSLGAAYPEGRVVVERVPIPGAGAAEGIESNSPIGSFAYWVADEGVKASVALADELSLRRAKGQSMPPGDWTRADLDRLVQMLPHGWRIPTSSPIPTGEGSTSWVVTRTFTLFVRGECWPT